MREQETSNPKATANILRELLINNTECPESPISELKDKISGNAASCVVDRTGMYVQRPDKDLDSEMIAAVVLINNPESHKETTFDFDTKFGTARVRVKMLDASTEENTSSASCFMDFGGALKAAKEGFKIAREGWNGRGMFIVYQKGYPNGIPCNKQTAEAWGMNEGDLFKCEPYLQMKSATGTHFMYTPNILDVLAEDWMIVE